MIALKIVVAILAAVLTVPILCFVMGEPQSYFEQHGREPYAIVIGLSAGAVGFACTRLVE